MNILENLALECSPYPVVNINSPSTPKPGLHHHTPKLCRKVFGRGECEQFYHSLRGEVGRHQCPYGFSVWPIEIGASQVAVTALIGAPRHGGDAERLRAKEYPANHVRIYRVIADSRTVTIRLTGSSVSMALLDERTIHIIPSAFIDNAVKCSQPGGMVEVHVSDGVRGNVPVITVEVTSNGPVATIEEERNLFVSRGRGKAGRAIAEGSGIGLTLAKIGADQHKGWISASQRQLATPGRAEWTFKFQVPRLP